jgi:hypothetical protein
MTVGRADRTIDPQVIAEQWDRMGQFYASLDSGHTTASVAFRGAIVRSAMSKVLSSSVVASWSIRPLDVGGPGGVYSAWPAMIRFGAAFVVTVRHLRLRGPARSSGGTSPLQSDYFGLQKSIFKRDVFLFLAGRNTAA